MRSGEAGENSPGVGGKDGNVNPGISQCGPRTFMETRPARIPLVVGARG